MCRGCPQWAAALGASPGMQDQLIDILAVVSGIVVIIVVHRYLPSAPSWFQPERLRSSTGSSSASPRRSLTWPSVLFAPKHVATACSASSPRFRCSWSSCVLLGMIGFGYTLALYGAGIKPMMRAFLFSGSALSTLGFESPGNNFWVIVLSAVEALTVVIDRRTADRLSADHLLLLPAARAGGQQPRRAHRCATRWRQGRRRLRQHLRTDAARGIVANMDRLVRRPGHLRIDPLR